MNRKQILGLFKAGALYFGASWLAFEAMHSETVLKWLGGVALVVGYGYIFLKSVGLFLDAVWSQKQK